MAYQTGKNKSKLAEAGIGDAEILFELGMIYCSGRDCDIDYVAAHKWFNIAAIKGSEQAVAMRNKLVSIMNKAEIAKALREARQWLTMH